MAFLVSGTIVITLLGGEDMREQDTNIWQVTLKMTKLYIFT